MTLELRKIAVQLHTSDEADLIKMAGVFSDLKRYVRRLYTKVFHQERFKFEESNDQLRDVITGLFGTLKALEGSIEQYDLDAYKNSLNVLKDNIAKLTALLTKSSGDAASVTNTVKQQVEKKPSPVGVADVTEPTPPDTDQPIERDPEVAKQLRDDSTYHKYIHRVQGFDYRALNGKILKDAEPFKDLLNDTSAHVWVSAGPFAEAQKWLKFNNIKIDSKENQKLEAVLKYAALNGKIVKTDMRKGTLKGHIQLTTICTVACDFTEPPCEIKFTLTSRYDPRHQRLNVLDFDRVKSKLIEGPAVPSSPVSSTAPASSPQTAPVDSVDLAKKSTSTLRNIRKFAVKNLGDNFFTKLVDMCNRLSMKPEDLLCVMWTESMGLDAAAGNPHGGAAGLIQFMPDTLKGVGFDGGSEEFRKLNGESQLPYIEKYVRNEMSINGGPFTSAAQYYLANFWPIALKNPQVKRNDPSAIIIDKDKNPKVYNENKGLDQDHDGLITLGDFVTLTNKTKQNPAFQAVVAKLKDIERYKTQPEPQPDTPESPETNDILNQFGLDKDFMKDLIQQIPTTAATTMTLEARGQDDANTAEFIRIVQCALRNELSIKSTVYEGHDTLQLSFNNPTLADVTSFIDTIHDQFVKAAKLLAPVPYRVRLGRTSDEPLSYKKAEHLYRLFRVQYLNR